MWRTFFAMVFSTSLIVSVTPSAATAAAPVPPAQAAPQGSAPTPQQRVAMLKQWLQASQAQLRSYQWIETTAVAVNGEEKSRKQDSCYYAVDGTLQKVPVAGAEEASGPSGPLRKRLAAKKKEELTAYMQSAVALVHTYLPPDPGLIQQAINSGNFSVSPAPQRVELTFRNYLKPNDALNIDVELPTNRLMGMKVSSYLDDPKDVIQLNATMSALPDATIFMQTATLNAPAKKLTVTVENSGYRHAGG